MNTDKPKNIWQAYYWLIFDPFLSKNYDDAEALKEIEDLPLKQRFQKRLSNKLLLQSLWINTLITLVLLLSYYNYLHTFSIPYDAWSYLFTFLSVITLFGNLFFSWSGNLFFSLLYGLFYNVNLGTYTVVSMPLILDTLLSDFLSVFLSFLLGFLLVLMIDYRGITKQTPFALFTSHFFGLIRIPFWFYYQIRHLLKAYSLATCPYYHDALIYLPIYRLDLVKQAHEDREEGEKLADFLFERRPHNQNLAFAVRYAVYAALWKESRLDSNVLDLVPTFNEKYKKHNPTAAWSASVQKLHELIQEYQAIGDKKELRYFRKSSLEKIQKELQYLHNLSQEQTASWKTYYLEAIQLWQKSTQDELIRIESQMKTEEKFGFNIYQTGAKLDALHKLVFMGRESLQAAFLYKVKTALRMPLFHLQGQRRVGKSSLISFLQSYLGNEYRVVHYDFQLKKPQTWAEFLNGLYAELIQDKSPKKLVETESYLEAFRLFMEKALAAAQQSQKSIILALDEYELLHFDIFEKNPQDAKDVLDMMRGFMQSQKQVIFLFSGSWYMTELKNPNWNEFFPQTDIIKVNYLTKTDIFNLVEVYELWQNPENFGENLKEYLFELTQGHPQLAQTILSELVTRINLQQKAHVSQALFEQVVADKITHSPANGVIDIFWTEFVQKRGIKEGTLALLNGKEADRKTIFLLEEHQFIRFENGNYRFVVPLFEQWIRRYGEVT